MFCVSKCIGLNGTNVFDKLSFHRLRKWNCYWFNDWIIRFKYIFFLFFTFQLNEIIRFLLFPFFLVMFPCKIHMAIHNESGVKSRNSISFFKSINFIEIKKVHSSAFLIKKKNLRRFFRSVNSLLIGHLF